MKQFYNIALYINKIAYLAYILIVIKERQFNLSSTCYSNSGIGESKKLQVLQMTSISLLYILLNNWTRDC